MASSIFYIGSWLLYLPHLGNFLYPCDNFTIISEKKLKSAYIKLFVHHKTLLFIRNIYLYGRIDGK